MKRGFTLIELLAVIVILAIIALIATPIVLNIIDDTKESATLRSADFYLDAVELAIANSRLKGQKIIDGTYNILESGNICLSYDTNNKCTEELEVEVSGETPKEGTIAIQDGEIDSLVLNLNNKTVSKSVDNKFIYPCTIVTGDKTTPGSKYECEVKPGTIYNFYVLSTEEDGSTNLIMDRNINSDGTLATEALNEANVKNGVYNLVAWVSKNDYNDDTNYYEEYGHEYGNNDKGPITAMNFLYNATKSWTNIPNIQMKYEDEGNTGYGYGTIITTNNVTKITKKDGSAVTVLTDKEGYTDLKARMPMYSEVTGTGKCSAPAGSCPLYLVNYLSSSSYVTGDGLQNISAIYGYWTLSSNYDIFVSAEGVSYVGYYSCNDVGNGSDFGVRPVINIKL